jgi:RNA polymerase sigma-70 factor, ECF subfamily
MFFNRLTEKSDEELMILLQQGHERAFTALYQRYGQPLFRYFFKMLWKDKSKAEDFLQDLFVKIIERPYHFEPSRKFSTWIYSVAHNMCKNEYRKQSYRNSVVLSIDVQVSEKKMMDDIDHKEFNVVLQRSMALWEEDDRTLFVLKHELEMTFAEIAAILNCPEGTARSRWFYLRKNLAAQLVKFQTIIK